MQNRVHGETLHPKRFRGWGGTEDALRKAWTLLLIDLIDVFLGEGISERARTPIESYAMFVVLQSLGCFSRWNRWMGKLPIHAQLRASVPRAA